MSYGLACYRANNSLQMSIDNRVHSLYQIGVIAVSGATVFVPISGFSAIPEWVVVIAYTDVITYPAEGGFYIQVYYVWNGQSTIYINYSVYKR